MKKKGGIVIEQCLKMNGPTRSSDLRDILVSQGVSEAAARQKISRLKGDIIKVRGLLSRNELILYHKEGYKSDETIEGIIKILLDSDSAYGAALSGLKAKGGLIPKDRFKVFSGVPVIDSAKQISFHSLLNKLKIHDLIEETTIDGEEFIQIRGLPNENRYIADSIVESLLIEKAEEWLKKTNFCSFNQVLSTNHSEELNCGGYAWDLTGPSYLQGIRKVNSSKPVSIVADVYLNRVLSLKDIRPLIKKYSSILAMKKITFTPIVFFDNCENEVLEQLKSSGFLTAKIDIFFGQEFAELLREIRDHLRDFQNILDGNPDKIIKVFKKLNIINGRSHNLRGYLFEFLVGYIFKAKGKTVKLRKDVLTSERKVEIDVLAEGHTKTYYVECKSFEIKNDLTVEDVKEWVETEVKLIRQKNKKDKQITEVKDPVFVLFSSKPFPDDVKEYIQEVRTKNRKTSLEFYDQNDIVNFLKDLGERNLKLMFQEYFINF